MGLKEKTIHSATWDVGCGMVGQAFQLCATVIMARLLMPSDFGVYGMALVFMDFLRIFAQFGMGAALIQKKDLTDEHFSSVFWLNVATGTVLCAIYMISAPFIAVFFRQPILDPMIKAVAIAFVLSSLTIVQVVLLTRELNFKKMALINLFAVVFGGILGIVLALCKFGAWSLVWSSISSSVLTVILLWITTRWKPAFVFSLDKIKALLSFSMNVLGVTFIGYSKKSFQNMLIGKFTSPAAFGYFSMANRIMLTPIQLVSAKVSNILFPAFSTIQDDLEKVREGYLKATSFISLTIFPVMMGIIILTPELVQVVLGQKWMPVVFLAQMLCLAGIFASIDSNINSIMLSQGHVGFLFKWHASTSIIMIAMVFFGLRWGVNGAAVFFTIGTVALTPFFTAILLRSIGLKFRRFLFALMPAVVSSVVMVACIGIFKYWIKSFFQPHAIVILALSIIFGIFVYLLTLRLLFAGTFREMIGIFADARALFNKNVVSEEIKCKIDQPLS